MRTLWTALCVLLVIHLLAAAVGVAWLAQTDRLSRERVAKAIDIFRPTIAEQKKQDEEAAKLAAEAEDHARTMQRLTEVAKGPKAVETRLEEEQAAGEVASAKIDRWQREARDMMRRLDMVRQDLDQQKAQLVAERKAFEQRVAQYSIQTRDADFQRAVSTYEALKPKQAKGMLQELLDQNQEAQVVDYLAAMQLRKAAAILNEFKSESEVAQAAKLLEQLRARGVEPLAARNADLEKPS